MNTLILSSELNIFIQTLQTAATTRNKRLSIRRYAVYLHIPSGNRNGYMGPSILD
jgi:hypothetical protein